MPVPVDLFAPSSSGQRRYPHRRREYQPQVSAVAIRDGRFVATGSDEEIRALAGPTTVVEDLGGAAVVPGLIDAHNHMQNTGIMLREVQLFDTRTIAEIVDRIGDGVKCARPGSGCWGQDWDESLLAEGRHPNRHNLDAVSPDNPVVIHRVWNKLVCNSAACGRSVNHNTPIPGGCPLQRLFRA